MNTSTTEDFPNMFMQAWARCTYTRCEFKLLSSFARVRERVPDTILIMVGGGKDKKNLGKLVYDLDIRNHVIFTGNVPYSEVPSYIAAADIAVSPIPPKWYFIISSPFKLIEYVNGQADCGK